MHILRLTRTYPDKKFKNIGLQAYMFSRYSKHTSTIFYKKNKNKYLKNRKNTKIYGINLGNRSLKNNYKLNINFFLVLINKFTDNILLFFNIIKKIEINKINFIHVHNINFLLAAVLINLFFRKEIVLSIGGSDIFNLKKKYLFNILIKRVTLVLSVSKQLQKEFLKVYPKIKCKVIGNGVDLKFYKYKKLKKKNIILAIGNIRWQKNYLTLIKAFNNLQKKYKKYRLIICGNIIDKSEYDNLITYLKKNSITNKVTFTGYLDPLKIRYLIYKSKILIISSISEGLPKVLLEGISCGTPIISTNVGDNSSVLKNKKLIVPKKNFKKMFFAINNLISSKKKYNEVRNIFLSRRKVFDWKNIVIKAEDIIEKNLC